MRYIDGIKRFSLFICLFSVFGFFTARADEGGNFHVPDPNMRIGLVFGSGTVASFQTSSDTGFIFGRVEDNSSEKFDVFFYTAAKKIKISRAAGRYNIEFTETFANFASAYKFIEELPKDAFKNAFPAYADRNIVVRCGNFSSAEAAKSHISSVSGKSPAALVVAASSSTAAVVTNPNTDAIIFWFEDSGSDFAAGAALPSSKNAAYGQSIYELSSRTTGFTTTPANNLNIGVFIYNITGAGVEVINLISLEEYVKGIVPYEVSPNWHDEALKAFSIAARTYALKSVNRHAGAGFMLCNSVHCQLYIGSRRATQKTNAAVDATKDLVLVYNGKIIEAVYHASSGGMTENHNDAWGGEMKEPYLASAAVPYEKYADPDRENSFWTNTVSPRELYLYLVGESPQAAKFKGIINSEIAKIIINERSPSSNYIKSVTVTDKNGNSVTIRNSDTIRSAFVKYANSANMDIYKSSKFSCCIISGKNEKALSGDIQTGVTHILASNGPTKAVPGDGIVYVLTNNGAYTVKAYSTGTDFVFDGKGWGHGVGLSQWGAQDMAEAGFKYEEILSRFYKGAVIEKIEKIEKN